MRNTKREIECLKRLQQLSPVYEELIQFLVQEFLLTKDELKAIRSTPEQARMLQTKLATLSTDRVIQLLEYEWTVLPVERIRLTLVTQRGSKEFTAEGN